MSPSPKQLRRHDYFYGHEDLALIMHANGGASALLRVPGAVLAQSDDGQSALYATDQQRSVLRFMSREASGLMQYSAYGVDAGQACASALRYSGQHKESITQCYFLGQGHRAFHPALMRFTSPDSLSPFGAGGINCYEYCAGDPVNNTDPSGRMPVARAMPASIRLKAGLANVVRLNPDYPGGLAPPHVVSESVVATVNGLGRNYGLQIETIMNARVWSKADYLLVQGTALKLTSNYGENLKLKPSQVLQPGFDHAALAQEQSRLLEAIQLIAPLEAKMQAAEPVMHVASWLHDSWRHDTARLNQQVRAPHSSS